MRKFLSVLVLLFSIINMICAKEKKDSTKHFFTKQLIFPASFIAGGLLLNDKNIRMSTQIFLIIN
jgi:hypothetical protein